MDLGVALTLLRDVGNDEAQEAAARALVLFAVDDCNKAVIAAAGSVPLLVDLVEHGGVGAKEQACWALTNLAVNPCLRRIIAEASGVETLLLAVVEDDGSDLCQAMAAAALANMAWDDDTAAIIMGMGAIDALVDLERSGSALVKEMVAWALGNLACSSPDKPSSR
ncbi:ubiquitin-protein transferase [Aureococcus anophagefferens]|nr:ubiquitin-protein transferase [Aureococcus anophagefferens]